MTTDITRKVCELCKNNPRPAMYDVRLQGSIGGGWALVCDIHYSYRQDDRFVVNLLTKSGYRR